MAQRRADLPGELPDLTGLSLHDLDELDGSAFAHAMRALLDPARRDDEAVAGFGSYADPVETD